jgi:DNA-binding transcriptional ArsR family regulator
MADPSRVKMLCALMDGRAWTATELSAAADVAPSTASGHLARLVEGQLITCLDWSERRFHLGGEAGAALLIHLESKGWIQRVAGYREVVVTASGKSAVRRLFSR